MRPFSAITFACLWAAGRVGWAAVDDNRLAPVVPDSVLKIHCSVPESVLDFKFVVHRTRERGAECQGAIDTARAELLQHTGGVRLEVVTRYNTAYSSEKDGSHFTSYYEKRFKATGRVELMALEVAACALPPVLLEENHCVGAAWSVRVPDVFAGILQKLPEDLRTPEAQSEVRWSTRPRSQGGLAIAGPEARTIRDRADVVFPDLQHAPGALPRFLWAEQTRAGVQLRLETQPGRSIPLLTQPIDRKPVAVCIYPSAPGDGEELFRKLEQGHHDVVVSEYALGGGCQGEFDLGVIASVGAPLPREAAAQILGRATSWIELRGNTIVETYGAPNEIQPSATGGFHSTETIHSGSLAVRTAFRNLALALKKMLDARQIGETAPAISCPNQGFESLVLVAPDDTDQRRAAAAHWKRNGQDLVWVSLEGTPANTAEAIEAMLDFYRTARDGKLD